MKFLNLGFIRLGDIRGIGTCMDNVYESLFGYAKLHTNLIKSDFTEVKSDS